jgi:hypothetical protein
MAFWIYVGFIGDRRKMTKDEYEDFALRYKGCGACFPMYHTLSRFEKMWFSAIQKDVAELEAENAELKTDNVEWEKASDKWKSLYESTNNQLTKAKELLKKCVCIINRLTPITALLDKNERSLLKQAEQFIKDNEVEKMTEEVPGTTLVGFSMFDLTVFYTFTVNGQDTIENYHQYKYIFTPDIKLDDDGYEMGITLDEIVRQIKKVMPKDASLGTVTVINDSGLKGIIYRYGNGGDYWSEYGETKGFA